LLVKYEWNNILHNYVEKIFVTTLESDSHVIKKNLLSDSNFLQFLNDATKDVEFTIPNSQQRKIRKGYLGHITKIATALTKMKEKDADIGKFLAQPAWEEFNERYLTKVLKQDNYDLAGIKKDHSDDDSEDIANAHFDNEIHRKFNAFNYNQDNNKDDDEEIEEREDFEDESPEKGEKEPDTHVHQNIDNLTSNFDENKVVDPDTWVQAEWSEENAKAHSDKSLWAKTAADLSEMKISEEQVRNDIIKENMTSPVKISNIAYSEDDSEVTVEKEYSLHQYWGIDAKASQENIDDILNEFNKY